MTKWNPGINISAWSDSSATKELGVRAMMDTEELVENFEFLGDWEERYRYIIELGKKLAPRRKRTGGGQYRSRLSEPGLAGPRCQ